MEVRSRVPVLVKWIRVFPRGVAIQRLEVHVRTLAEELEHDVGKLICSLHAPTSVTKRIGSEPFTIILKF